MQLRKTYFSPLPSYDRKGPETGTIQIRKSLLSRSRTVSYGRAIGINNRNIVPTAVRNNNTQKLGLTMERPKHSHHGTEPKLLDMISLPYQNDILITLQNANTRKDCYHGDHRYVEKKAPALQGDHTEPLLFFYLVLYSAF